MLEVITAQGPGQCQIFFNISGNVGIGSPNDRIDVESRAARLFLRGNQSGQYRSP